MRAVDWLEQGHMFKHTQTYLKHTNQSGKWLVNSKTMGNK